MIFWNILNDIERQRESVSADTKSIEVPFDGFWQPPRDAGT